MNVPSQTLYVQNLNEKTKKQGASRRRRASRPLLSRSFTEMKRALHLCFSSYGRVLDVVCLKTTKLRGQVRRRASPFRFGVHSGRDRRRAGVGGVCRRACSHKRASGDAGLQLL